MALLAILTATAFTMPNLAAAAINANGGNAMPAQGGGAVPPPPPAQAPNGINQANQGRAPVPSNARQPDGNINSHQQMQIDKNSPPSNPGGTNKP